MGFYKNIFDNIPEAAVISDSSYSVIRSNIAFRELIKCKNKDIITLKFKDFIILNNTNCPICSCKNDFSFIPENYNHIADLKTGENELIPVRITHKVLDNGNIILMITPLSEMICLNQAHMDFVSTVSHELRTPLTSIKGFADTLLASGDRLDKEQQTRFISIIKNQIDRLTRLVENLLTVSRLESHREKIIFKAIDFNIFIENLMQGIYPKAKEHIITVNISDNLPQIWADSDKLEQIMTNLIDNAIKYSYPSTEININTTFSSNNNDNIVIKISNHGVDITKEHLNKIFTKFSRLDNPLTRQVQGTGLGLYITKSLVESMGGNISAENKDGLTIFSIKLPIATPEKHALQKFKEDRG